MIRIIDNYLNWEIIMEVKSLGNDLNIQIYGGSHPHLGCAVLAVHSANLNQPSKNDCTISMLCLSGHKEGELFTQVAKRICKALKKTCLISGGVHIDNLTSSQIQELVDLIIFMSEKVILQIKAITI